MKKSISYWSFEGGLDNKKPIKDAMREAKAAGYDCIELAFAASGPLSPETTEAECRKILADARSIGIEISSLCTGMYWDSSLTDDDADVRQKAYDLTVSYIEHARMLKVKHVLVVPGAVDVFFKPGFKTIQYDIVWKRSVQQLKKLAKEAKKNGVTICVENVWNKFLLSPIEMRFFLDEISSPNVACYFDVGNIMLYGFPQQWVRSLGKRIKRVHFKDFKTSVGTAAGFCDLLAGDVPWGEVMKAFREVGYDGPCTGEMMPWDPTLVKRTSEAMDKIFAM